MMYILENHWLEQVLATMIISSDLDGVPLPPLDVNGETPVNFFSMF